MKNRLICQMIVRNEGTRYLASVLAAACKWADKIIIVDDYSTDSTMDICRSFGEKVVVVQHTFGKSMFGENESALREHLWELVRKEAKEGDWIVSLDADEEFSSNFIKWSQGFINSTPEQDYITFKLLDMWTPTQYRIDGLWSPFITRMFRYQDQPFGLTGTIHCGCIPAFVWKSGKEFIKTDLKLKHLGWVRDEDKDRKYQFYMERATGINLVHAKSIKIPALLHEYTEELPNVLVASLIRNRAWCLPEFLKGLDKQTRTYPKDKLSYVFIINDSTDESEKILAKWATEASGRYREVKLLFLDFGNADAVDHTWSDVKLQNMAIMRDRCLDLLKESDSQFLLSIDSDVILKEDDTLRHLVNIDKSIVSEVFWATWEQKGARPLPNVWISGGYGINDVFLTQLKKPGLYEVGGLGAITLIHRDVVDRGVNYQRVSNLPHDMRGEDRDFCTRAICAGFKLWADTCKTPLHIERAKKPEVVEPPVTEQQMLAEVKREVEQPVVLELPPGENTISLCMVVKNEERNLRSALISVKPLVQEIIIVDSGSTDSTRSIAAEFTDKIYDFQWCDDFAAARNFALSKATKKWILFLDGDELVPPETLKQFHQLVCNPDLVATLVPVKNVHLPVRDKTGNYHYSETYRLFRNMPEIRYEGCVHEDIATSLENLGKIQKVGVTRATAFITNLGFLLRPTDLKVKHEYYAKLILKEIQQRPDYFKAYYEYAVYLLDKGELDEAEQYYKKSLQLNPSFWMSHNDLGVIQMKKSVNAHMLTEAAAHFDIAAVTAAKRASQHQLQVIGTNVNISRQIIKYLNIGPVPEIKTEESSKNLIKT